MAKLSTRAASDLFRRAPDRYIEVGAGAVAYRKVGEGPDVLFVHGWPFSSATFRYLLPHLADHVTCHLIDLVGMGQSRFDRSVEISMRNWFRSIPAVVDTLGLDSVAVLGHDSGGLFARHGMAADPRLRAMVLMDTESPFGLTEQYEQLVRVAQFPGFAHLFALAMNIRRLRRSEHLLGTCFTVPTLLEGEFEEFFITPLRDDPDHRWATAQLVQTFERHYITELVELHRKITAPVLLVWGEHDPVYPLEGARKMVETFPDARLHVIPGMKLFPHEERPTEVAAAILPTLVGDGT